MTTTMRRRLLGKAFSCIFLAWLTSQLIIDADAWTFYPKPCTGRPNLTPVPAVSVVNAEAVDIHDDDEEEDTEHLARSSFGTKRYWDDVYSGCGDFPSEGYSWYYDFGEIKRHLPVLTLTERRALNVFIPGIGNDPILLDMIQAGYRTLTAQDYSRYAIERQRDLLQDRLDPDSSNFDDSLCLELSHGNVLDIPVNYEHRYGMVLEKGLLDAVYLSGDGRVERAVASLAKTVQSGGYFVSVSGVVPEDLRRDLFLETDWTWLRDGSKDLKAGCFVFQKKRQ